MVVAENSWQNAYFCGGKALGWKLIDKGKLHWYKLVIHTFGLQLCANAEAVVHSPPTYPQRFISRPLLRNLCKQSNIIIAWYKYRKDTQSHALKKGWGWWAIFWCELPGRIARGMVNLALCLLVSWSVWYVGATPLDDYVNAPDNTYGYEDLGDPFIGKGFTSHFINLTSQTWLTSECLRERPRTDLSELFDCANILFVHYGAVYTVVFLLLIS